MIAVDEETVLDGLDFSLCCEAEMPRGTCGVEATFTASCAHCGRLVCVLCDGHALLVRTRTDRCCDTECGWMAPLRDLLRVMPL